MTWRSKKDRVPQPPMVAASRDPERHSFWPGAVVGAIGLLLLLIGANHTTGLETADGDKAREHQLVKAFAHGGLRAAPPPKAPDMASFDDPVQAAEALEQFARQEAESTRIKYTVHTSAVDPCPT